MKTIRKSPHSYHCGLLAIALASLGALSCSHSVSASPIIGPAVIDIGDVNVGVAYGSIDGGSPSFAAGEFYADGIRIGGEEHYAAAFKFDISAYAGGTLADAYFSIFQTDITLGTHELTLEVYGFDPGANWTESSFSSTDLNLIEVRSHFGGNGSNRDFDITAALQSALDANYTHIGFRLTDGLTWSDPFAYIDFASSSPRISMTVIPEPSSVAMASIALLAFGGFAVRHRVRSARS